jgi:hypothetical protein
MNKITIHQPSPPPQLFKALTKIEEQFAVDEDGRYEDGTLGRISSHLYSQLTQSHTWLHPYENVEFWSKQVDRDFEFWQSDDVAAWIKDLTDGLGRVLATLQSVWPDEDIFAPASDEEIKFRISVMIGGLNLSLVSPHVFIEHLIVSIAATEPYLMALVTAMREIVESGRYEKKLAVHDVLEVVAKHQEKWDERVEMLRSYQDGTYEENVQPLTERLQKIELQQYRLKLINKWRSNEHTEDLLAVRKALPAHLHWQHLMRLERYRQRDAIVEREALQAREVRLSVRRWIKCEKRSRRQQVLHSIRYLRSAYRYTAARDHHDILRRGEKIERIQRLRRRINWWSTDEDRRNEVFSVRYRYNRLRRMHDVSADDRPAT